MPQRAERANPKWAKNSGDTCNADHLEGVERRGRAALTHIVLRQKANFQGQQQGIERTLGRHGRFSNPQHAVKRLEGNLWGFCGHQSTGSLHNTQLLFRREPAFAFARWSALACREAARSHPRGAHGHHDWQLCEDCAPALQQDASIPLTSKDLLKGRRRCFGPWKPMNLFALQ